MYLHDNKNDYIITLIDASENEIENRICMEGFSQHQLLLVDKSGYAISQEVTETPFSAGDVIYVAAGRRFGIRCDGSMRIFYIAFTGRSIRPMMHYCHLGEFRVISPPSGKNPVGEMFEHIFNLKNLTSAYQQTDISTALYTLLAYLGSVNIENDNYMLDKNGLLLKSVKELMQQNYRKPYIDFERIAMSAGISAQELNDLFRDTFLMSVEDFYKQIRMKNAKHLLFFYADRGISYVAENMGYTDVGEFQADFYEQFHMSADKFIHLYRQNRLN